MKFEHEKTNDILKWFEKINQIPRCSGNEEAIRNWLMSWAEENHLEIKTDEVGNLLIKVPASFGYEKSPIVVLQGHLDMVCEKTPDSNHDFANDSIKLMQNGEWLTADKTTLGADNGIAIAMAMTLASIRKEVPHPPLELLFTVDEERGLVGASALTPDFFEGRILINLDSEDEKYFIVGCAGGSETHLSLPIKWVSIPTDYRLMKVNVDGVKGGHSGIDINTERANAIKILARTLYFITQQVDIRLADLNSGTASNVIPHSSEAFAFVSKNDFEEVKSIALKAEKILKAEYKNTEPELFISVDNTDNVGVSDNTYHQAMTLESTNKVIDFLMVLPHGVAAMSTDIEGLVETSNNLAQVSIDNKQLKTITSQRSSVESRLEALTHRIEAVVQLAGGVAHSDNHYPAWQPNMDSSLLAKSVEIYKKLFNKAPMVKAIHAGLETGTIGKKIQGMDMIAIGPTIKNPHSPDEKLLIGSIGKIWDFLLALLKELK